MQDESEKTVESTQEDSQDKLEMNRLQGELDAARREIRDYRQAWQHHRELAVKVHESFLPQSVRHLSANGS